MTLDSLMTRKVIRVEPDCPVHEVLKKLRAYRISCVIVCEDDVPVGVISERDIVGLAYKLISGREGIPQAAKKLMSASVVSASSDGTLQDAIDLVEKHHIRHLPVVDGDGKLVGLLTQTDLMHAAIRQAG